MKILTTIFCLALLVSCKDSDNKEEVIHDTVPVSEIEASKKVYPKPLEAVFNAHGGISKWNRMNNLCFEMKGEKQTEIHTVSLPDRRTKIETESWSIGYDGSQVWLLEREEGSFKGNARFYHNLMFYFYAMPFVLGDEGINYLLLEPAELDDETFSAIKISFEDGVGDAPEDEYILYFDPDTNRMRWLAYTVTYFENTENKDWHYIKYEDWEEVNELLLPKELVWYTVEDDKPVKKRNSISFDKVTVTETMIEDSVFKKPEQANIVER